MKKSICLVHGTFVAILVLLCPEQLLAAEAPKSPERLREAASHVVTGEVTRIEISSVYSEIEEGSFDYAIRCTIAVDTVEKGEGVKPGDQINANCFRPKTRLAFGQFASLQGHSPIPAPGQKVRAYLVKGRVTYSVVHPNGFAPTDIGRLVDADEVTQMRRWSPVFTLLLPLELWVLIGVLVLPAAIVVVVVPRPRLRKVLKLLLAAPAGLWAAGLIVGVLQFVSTIGTRETWIFHAAVMLLGMSVVLPCVALSVWLGVTALRRPPVAAEPQAAVPAASVSTSAAEQNAVADGGRDSGSS
jgi:hypothetical protein